MDLTGEKGKRILTKKTVNVDGSVTVTTKPKRQVKKRVVIARGTGEHTIGAVITSQLLPFRSVMIKQLNRRGFNTRTLDFKTLIPLYYNEFVSNNENKSSKFIPINAYEFRINPAFRIHPSDNFNGELSSIHADYFGQVSDITDTIINLFRISKLKKRSALLSGINPKQVLTDEELVQAKAAEIVEKKLEDKMLNNTPVRYAELKKIFYIGLSIWLLWYLLK